MTSKLHTDICSTMDQKKVIARCKQMTMTNNVVILLYNVFRSKILEEQDAMEVLEHLLTSQKYAPNLIAQTLKLIRANHC